MTAVLAVAALPWLLGTTWAAVRSVVGSVPLAALGLSAVLWWAGLCVYTVTLTGALPGLSRRRALLLNLTGSAVSNVLPAGGAFGTWLNVSMLRGWGFPSRRIADFTVTSNLFDVVGKLAVCGAALVLTAAAGTLPGRVLVLAASVAGAVVVLLAVAAAVSSRTGSGVVARAVLVCGRAFGGGTRVRGSLRRVVRVRAELRELRRRVRQAVTDRWRPLTGGVVGYVLLQGALFAVCLHLTGAAADPSSRTVSLVVVAFVADRLASALPITPGGTGFAEAGATAALLTGGVPAGAALAGVLLYRLFVVVLEIPVGGLALLGWLGVRRAGAAVPS